MVHHEGSFTLASAVATALLVFLIASAARAVDGVLEINQACAVNTGCFLGDTAGFPVTIDGSAGTSYRLTGDLTPPISSVNAVSVTGSNVTLDLNGFAVLGPTRCTPQPVTSCLPLDGGSGIVASAAENVTIRNGKIQGMTFLGVGVGRDSLLEDLVVKDNGGTFAVWTGGNCVVRNLRVRGNGGVGIQTSGGSMLTHNVVSGNADQGIVLSAGQATFNVVNSNGRAGIDASLGSAVIGNSVRTNGGFGLDLAGGTGYTDNVINSNIGGTVSGGVAFGTNVCNGTTTCP